MLISPRSKAFRAQRKKLDYHAVCLIGWEGPRPASFGDNRGIWPVRVAITKKEMSAADRPDIESPHVGVIVLEYVMVETEVHAKKLKKALDEVLLGEQEGKDNSGLRHAWKNCRDCWDQDDADPAQRDESRSMWFGLILNSALRILERTTTSFNVYDADTVYRTISKRAMAGR